MLEQLRRIIPTYYIDKFEGLDAKRVYGLPNKIRHKLIYGNKKMFSKIISEIHDEERAEHRVILGEAGEDLVREMRQMVADTKAKH